MSGKNFFGIKLFILFIFFYSFAAAQSKEEIINRIDSYVEDIHLDTNLRTVTLQNTEFLENMTDGGGELTGFYKKDKFYRIYQSVAISYGVYITEYYYHKEQLIFVRDNFNAYVYDDSLKTFDYTKSDNTYSGVFYFDKGRIIHSSSRGHGRTEEDTVDAEKFFLNESVKDLMLLRKKLNEAK